MENKSTQMISKDHPGVYVPPPLIYVSIFFVSIVIQRVVPIQYSWFTAPGVQIIAWSFIAAGIFLLTTSLWRFLVSKNTLIPIKPAQSLQTSGIYAITRNPMYLALICLYLGIAVFKGNVWTFVLAPIVVIIVQSYVIKKEEQYLIRAFGDLYLDYMKKVRRWI
jgi:protein-S-isoprenylcysteine O-methyltransferase Ste14